MTSPAVNRGATLAWIGLMLALASIGTVNMAIRILPDSRLGGYVTPPPEPKLTAAAVWAESFQRQATAWYSHAWGLRGTLVRTDNTLNVGLLRETRTGQHVLIGDRGVLFNYEDDGYVNRARSDDEASSLEMGRLIGRVQKKARASGRALVPVVIPSKTSTHRDAYPAARRRAGAFGRSDETVYGALVRGMTEGGTSFVDARAFLLAEARSPEDIFARTSRHWTWGAACRTLQRALDVARLDVPELGDEQVDCHVHLDPHPRINGWELDLFWLINVWNEAPRDVQAEIIDGKRGGLRVPTLFVGTSFVTMFAEIAHERDVLQPSLFYYYNQRVSNTMSLAQQEDIVPHTPRWREDTMSKRLVILGMLETFAPADGKTFLEQYEKELDALSSPSSR
jgi:hypothetical protein